VGGAGNGVFVATLSAAATCNGPLNIGLSPSGTGLVRAVGSGAVNANAGVGVGGSPNASGGTGTLRAEAGGDISVSGLFRVWANGIVVAQSGSTLDSASTIELCPGGVAQVDSGTISGPAILLTGSASVAGTGATLTGIGTMNANISGTGFGNLIAPTGALTLGNSASTLGFDSTNITSNIGAHTLTLLDRNAAVVGNTTLTAGTLDAPNGITVASTKTISGGGTIDAPTITLGGGINATTPQGFVIKGIASGAGGLTGTLFDFSNTGGFTGSGTINSQIRGTTGSIITATGNLSLGTASSVGFSFDGTLRTNANQITLHDTSTAFVGNIEMAGGTVFCTDTDMTSDIGDVTSGFGTIATSGRTWLNAGTIRPSGAGTDATGQIGSFGNVNMENVFNSAVLDMDIGGTAAADVDKLAVLGALTLDGTLRVRFVPGYVPAGGEVYTIVTASSMTGAFTSVDLPPRTLLFVNTNNVQIGAMCPADQNGDGAVDGDDVIEFFAVWDAGNPAGDFNSDGGVDGDDVIGFFEHWDSGC
ncbi:MAG: GC-type dockerin domain-anchored protein, partial [Phycisphaerales bacterium]